MRRLTLQKLPLLFAALLLLPAAAVWATGQHPGDAVRVNGVTISNERFNSFYQEYRRPFGLNVAGRGDYLDKLQQLRKEAMHLMIEQELVRQAAIEKGIGATSDEIDATIVELSEPFDDADEYERRLQSEGFTPQSYREHLGRMIAAKKYLDEVRLSVGEVSDAELEKYYRENEYRLTFPEQVRVRHILLTWKPLGTTDDKGAIRRQMQPLLERARAGEDFAALAREFSDDYATKGAGGDTGLFQRGDMVPAFEDVAFVLKPGEISDPVETVFGVHILKLEEHRESYLVPLDEVREKLRNHMLEEKMEAAVKQEIARLREEGEVQILIPLERPQRQN